MSEQGFLEAIIAEPDDDTHRLVYADWLEEHGHADRARFIRAQVEMARFYRPDEEPGGVGAVSASELLPEHRRAFLAPLLALGLSEYVSRYHDGAEYGFGFYFRRGFVEDLVVFGTRGAAQFVEHAEGLFRLTPLQRVRFRPADQFPRSPGFDRFSPRLLDDVVCLPQVGRLRRLDLRGLYLGPPEAEVLLRSPRLPGRTFINLEGNYFGPEAAQKLREKFGEAVAVSDWDEEIPF
jgi:uncharacterized protein (TIGR02996 family)